MSKKILIVGGVAGGASAAARLRRLDENAEIVMLERDGYISFANCGLPYYIGDTIKSRDALLLQTPEEFRTRFRVDVRIYQEVTAIDRSTKTVTVRKIQTGETYTESYDVLLLSPGATPLRPPIPGLSEANNVFTLRNIPDTDAIRAFTDERAPKRAVIIGGGFIGLEMAENLRARDIRVTVVEMLDQVMAPLDPEMAAIVQNHLRDSEVDLILSDGVASFKDSGQVVVLKSGREIPTDLIILSIGVRPENTLAATAGLEVGQRGGIRVNEWMQTTLDEAVYAIGDATEIRHFITQEPTQIPLAWPANRQGRLAADNIMNGQTQYQGTLGTAVAKVFDLTAASTGLNEKQLCAQGAEYQTVHIHPQSHASYYPGATPISMKLLFHPKTGEIYGAQCVGAESVEKHIDIIATAIRGRIKAQELQELELAYAPPYSSAKSPVNMLGYVAENVMTGMAQTFQWHEVDHLPAEAVLLDVREPMENETGNIAGSVNIPLGELRNRLNELPAEAPIFTYCQVGQRGYIAARILAQNGFRVKNLDGGYRTYSTVKYDQEGTAKMTDKCNSASCNAQSANDPAPSPAAAGRIVRVDACGLQCPGPIMKVFNTIKEMSPGETLEITTTDSGFAKDIGSWCSKTGNTLLELQRDGKTYTASILKGTGGDGDIAQAACTINAQNAMSGKEGTTLVVFSGDLDKAMASFIIASGAAAMGRKVSMFFTFWGLNILRKKGVSVSKPPMDTMFGMMMPAHAGQLPLSKMNMAGMGTAMMKKVMRDKNVDSLETLMSNAQKAGVKFIACAMSMDVMGIRSEELIDGVEIGGVATYLSDASESNINLFI